MNHIASTNTSSDQALTLHGPMNPGYDEILSAEALSFLAQLEDRFGSQRLRLLSARQDRQSAFDDGARPDFLQSTAGVRAGDWSVAPTPSDLQDRRVEITGPVDRKMVINALNSGAKIFMADFEDSSSPTWTNMVEGQISVRDAARRTIAFEDEARGKSYNLKEQTAVLIVRPRGWHLEEAHVRLNGRAMSASLFDFGLYAFHNAKALNHAGSGAYFYLPKLESHLEARLWDEAFSFAERTLGLDHGSLKATVLIETITAAFEMDEILYELKDHIVGLNCGRWDYIFSIIKRFRNQSDLILPDRALVTMTSPALRAYSLLSIQTCHRRNAHAIGGMAAQIPIKADEAANAAALAKVEADKQREARDGHDGTWVAHPALVPIAMAQFDGAIPSDKANQKGVKRLDVNVTAADLLTRPEGAITEDGLRMNIRVGIQYLEAWLRGSGCVPLYNLMEDAATAEISRAQIWQWLRHEAKTEGGQAITEQWVKELTDAELDALPGTDGDGRQFDLARDLFLQVAMADQFEEFLTLPAYQHITEPEARS